MRNEFCSASIMLAVRHRLLCVCQLISYQTLSAMSQQIVVIESIYHLSECVKVCLLCKPMAICTIYNMYIEAVIWRHRRPEKRGIACRRQASEPFLSWYEASSKWRGSITQNHRQKYIVIFVLIENIKNKVAAENESTQKYHAIVARRGSAHWYIVEMINWPVFHQVAATSAAQYLSIKYVLFYDLHENISSSLMSQRKYNRNERNFFRNEMHAM